MKSYSFPAYISFGKFDNAETIVEIELSEEEASLLEKCAAEDDYFHLDECEKIGPLYDKVFSLADEQFTQELRFSDAELGTDYCRYAEDEDDPDSWTASCTYTIGVNFPEELQWLKSRREKEPQDEDYDLE